MKEEKVDEKSGGGEGVSAGTAMHVGRTAPWPEGGVVTKVKQCDDDHGAIMFCGSCDIEVWQRT